MATAGLLSLLSVLCSILVYYSARAQSSQNCWEMLLEGNVVDCSGKQLTRVPQGLPEDVKTLKLNGNQILQIHPTDFAELNNLEELVLSDNPLQEISSQAVCGIPSLAVLKLSRNRLDAIPDVSECQSLRELSVANNRISRIDSRRLFNQTKLQKLDLSRNNLTVITIDSLPVNTDLKMLILTGNSIERIEANAFVNVQKLEKLRLGRNKLTELPEFLFSNLSKLILLDLSKNQISRLEHSSFDGLSALRDLNLERNRISHLGDGSFYKCASLEKLNLESNLLTSVKPGPLFGLRSLTYLYMGRNEIRTIEARTSSWSEHALALQYMDLSRNKLTVIKSTYFLNAGSMRDLNLSNNEINQLEEGAFDSMTDLETLDLSENKLSDNLQSASVPVFSKLQNLKTLSIHGNNIQTVSVELLRGLVSLTTLNLLSNPVATIESYAFSALPSLASLEISTDKLVCDCMISWLPPWLTESGFDSTTSAKCSLPRKHRGKNVMDVDSNDFKCDLGDMTPKPQITRQLRNTNALQGSNVTLTCIATTNSPATVRVEWRKNNEIIPKSSGLIETDATTADGRSSMYTTYLHLVKVGADQEGQYQCGFVNDYGSDYSEVATLQVLVFPSFVNTPSNVTVKTGTDARLICEATGYPMPNLSWSKDGGESFPAARDRRFKVNPENLNEFIITDVQWQDRGIYYCNASNIAGSIISNATLSVMVPPMFTSAISCTTTDKGTDKGTYVLKCQAEGNPQTSIAWYKDGKPVTASDRYVFSVTYNNLFIVDGTEEDSGVYICAASNTLGMISDSCNVRIMGDATTTVDSENGKKPVSPLDKNTITGLIVIAVVCCVVGTSLVWVVIIYQTRRRRGDNSSNNTEETTVPLNGALPNGQKFVGPQHDNISDGSHPSKSDSFLEYRSSSRDSPPVFGKNTGRVRAAAIFPSDVADSELASALEPLTNNSEDSIGGLSDYYSGTSGVHSGNGLPQSMSAYYVTEQPHPFSTFQPSRQRRCQSQTGGKVKRPTHSASAEYIPYIDKSQPPDLAQLLHQFKAPSTRPPELAAQATPAVTPKATVAPVHNYSAQSIAQTPKTPQYYEEPGYMNLPKSAITPSAETLPKLPAKYTSEYMNVTDLHIYQNSHDLLLKAHQREAERSANDSQVCSSDDHSYLEAAGTSNSKTSPEKIPCQDASHDSNIEANACSSHCTSSTSSSSKREGPSDPPTLPRHGRQKNDVSVPSQRTQSES